MKNGLKSNKTLKKKKLCYIHISLLGLLLGLLSLEHPVSNISLNFIWSSFYSHIEWHKILWTGLESWYCISNETKFNVCVTYTALYVHCKILKIIFWIWKNMDTTWQSEIEEYKE